MFEEEEEKDGALEGGIVSGLRGNDNVNFSLGKRYAAVLERFAPSMALPPPEKSELVGDGS